MLRTVMQRRRRTLCDVLESLRLKDRKHAYAVLVGLDSMQGLQAARILKRRKVPVLGIIQEAKHHARWTNACEHVLFADDSCPSVIDLLESLGPRLAQRAVLYPCIDDHVLLVSQNRNRLCHWYRIVLPDNQTVEMFMDKAAFYDFAQQEGLPIPKTRVSCCRADAQDAAADLAFPCILKPSYRGVGWTSHTTIKAFLVETRSELVAIYDQYHDWCESMILQEWIAGTDADLYSCNCYFDHDSRPLAAFVARKLRQWPPLTGQSSLGEECLNETVLQTTLQLFQRAGYQGLAYLEMKRDAATGRYFIVEPNIGRPTGRSAIAEAGGVELLYTMYADAVGLPLPTNRNQAYGGVKWIHLRRDLQSAAYYWWCGKLTFWQWWSSLRGRKAYALWSWRDPLPFVMDVLRVLTLLGSKKERSKRSICVSQVEAPSAAIR